MTKLLTAVLILILLETSVYAHHRQTPPIVAFTISGDTALPRLRAGWRRVALALDDSQLNPKGYFATPAHVPSGHQIFRQEWHRKKFDQVSVSGDNANPTIDVSGFVLAWDTDCNQGQCFGTDSGRQIFEWMFTQGFLQVTHDPTGSSVNPALSGQGDSMAFESVGDLAGTGNSGVRQIFFRTTDGNISQVSQGQGASQNAALSWSGRIIAYESTNDAMGTDTGIRQIWVGDPSATPQPITSGGGPSRLPDVSPDGRYVVFESTAALASDGHDTGVSEIFYYDTRLTTITQLTADPQGCTGASIDLTHRVGFVCHGEGFFDLLSAHQRFRVPITGGETQQTVTDGGGHFIVVSTTANLSCPNCSGAGCAASTCASTGTNPGHQLYLLNLYKLGATPIPQF
jgi:hypothetical protein